MFHTTIKAEIKLQHLNNHITINNIYNLSYNNSLVNLLRFNTPVNTKKVILVLRMCTDSCPIGDSLESQD